MFALKKETSGCLWQY